MNSRFDRDGLIESRFRVKQVHKVKSKSRFRVNSNKAIPPRDLDPFFDAFSDDGVPLGTCRMVKTIDYTVFFAAFNASGQIAAI